MFCLLYTTWPDMTSVKSVANQALEHKLCACVNILPLGTSLYRWNGSLHCEEECYAFFKTHLEKRDDLISFLVQEHPYDVPAILDIQAELPFVPYQNFIAQAVRD